MNKKTEKARRKGCRSRPGLSPGGLKRLREELREYLEGLRAQIDQLADVVGEACRSMSDKAEEGLREEGE